jgi:hypothetical protein
MLLLVTGIVGSFASVLSDGSSVGKYVKYISALICVLVIVSPLSANVPKIEFEQPQISMDDTSSPLYENAIAVTENQIRNKIIEKFGIIPKDISIKIDGDENITVTVELQEKDLSLKPEIDKYISSIIKS